MNKLVIIGNLAADPEARTTQSGKACATFRVAVQREFANANGVREADFFTVIAWNQTADYVTKYQTKGSKVAVEGRVQFRSYTAQDGSKRTVTEVIADRVEGLSSRGDVQKQPETNDGFTEIPDADLPF